MNLDIRKWRRDRKAKEAIGRERTGDCERKVEQTERTSKAKKRHGRENKTGTPTKTGNRNTAKAGTRNG